MSKAENNKPVAHVRVAMVQGSIWKRETDKGTFYDASFQRSYKSADGKWHNSQTGYNLPSLLALQQAVDQAIKQITALNGAAHTEVADEDAA